MADFQLMKWGKNMAYYNHKDHLQDYGGFTKEEFEEQVTVPDQAVDIKQLVKRVEGGRPKPTE